MSTRVLVIDDAPEVQRLVRGILEGEGYHVEAAGTAAEGLKILKSDPVGMLVLDLNLPDQQGTDFCRELRDDGYDLPILMLTTHNSVNDRARGLELGADDYLGKPFAPEELVARVGAHLRRQRIQADKIQSLLSQRWEMVHRGMALAHRIQQPLVTTRLTSVQAAIHHLPVGRVGGDLYLVEERGHDTYVLVGDTMGKGLPAALVMSWTLATLHDLVAEGVEPAEIVNQAHRLLKPEMEDLGLFVTLFCARYHRPSRTLSYVSAGSEPGLLLSPRTRGRRHQILTTKGLPLGVADSPDYSHSTLAIAPGSRLFVYTDGLLDSVELAGQAKLFRDIYRILLRFIDRPVESLPGALMQQLRMVAPRGITLKDDLTFVLLELE